MKTPTTAQSDAIKRISQRPEYDFAAISGGAVDPINDQGQYRFIWFATDGTSHLSLIAPDGTVLQDLS